MTLILSIAYFLGIAQAIKVFLVNSNIEVDIALTSSILFGSSYTSGIDEEDKEFGCVQVALFFLVVSVTYDR